MYLIYETYFDDGFTVLSHTHIDIFFIMSAIETYNEVNVEIK